MKTRYDLLLSEKFGKPIGSFAGEPMVGVRDERDATCSTCGMMPINDVCDCMNDEMCEGCGMSTDECICDTSDVCPICGEMPVKNACSCNCDYCGIEKSMCQCGMNEAKKSGPSKKTARKIMKGAVTATQKANKVKDWAKTPFAAANWMAQKAEVPFHGKSKK